MKKILFFAILIYCGSCEPRQGKSVDEGVQQATNVTASQADMHKIVAQEVLQANSYTYVKGSENDVEIWIAIPKREVEIGKTYYYEQAMEMKNFKSKDLDRTFESVLFIKGISEAPGSVEKVGTMMPPSNEMQKKKAVVQKQELNIQREEGVTLISELYASKAAFENKKIKVKGLVTKYNPSIMNKNWIHIQDGTGSDDSFDLTITTQDVVEIGAIVTFEGTIALNKDFGYGYKYDLIMEDGIRLNKGSSMKVN